MHVSYNVMPKYSAHARSPTSGFKTLGRPAHEMFL
jgi:hypothetical protein